MKNKNLVRVLPVDRINRITIYSTEYESGVKSKVVGLEDNYGIEIEYWLECWVGDGNDNGNDNGNEKRLASFYMSVDKNYCKKIKEDFEKLEGRLMVSGLWLKKKKKLF